MVSWWHYYLNFQSQFLLGWLHIYNQKILLVLITFCRRHSWCNGYYVALCGRAAKADESVLARNQTKDSWTWNLAVSGSGKGTRMRVGDRTRRRAVGAGQQAGVDDATRQRAVGVGQQRGEQQRVGVEPRTGAVNTGYRSREARQHGIGSSDSESRWVWFQ